MTSTHFHCKKKYINHFKSLQQGWPQKLINFQLFQSQRAKTFWFYCHCCSEQHIQQLCSQKKIPNREKPCRGKQWIFCEEASLLKYMHFRNSLLTFLLVLQLSKSMNEWMILHLTHCLTLGKTLNLWPQLHQQRAGLHSTIFKNSSEKILRPWVLSQKALRNN